MNAIYIIAITAISVTVNEMMGSGSLSEKLSALVFFIMAVILLRHGEKVK